MRSIKLNLVVANRDATSVYATVRDFRRYPELAPAVRSVDIVDDDGTTAISHWEVTFRKGLMRWVEEDVFDAEARRIQFRQLEGDIALFDGSWTCTDIAGGTRITFEARIDMGIPSLADALEPIAARALVENVVAIVTGLVGDTVAIENVDVEAPAPDRPAVPSAV